MPAPRMKRFDEQRWLLDAMIRQIGVEWDQARLSSKSRCVSPESQPLFRAVGARVKKYDDIYREFAASARRQHERAEAYAAQGRGIAACEGYLIASLMWTIAAWPIHEDCPKLRNAEEQANICYSGFMTHAPRPIERVDVPLGDKAMPAYLHLPRQPAPGERFPVILSIGGMDLSKENMVSLYGDRMLERGFAVLAIDGPGQAEAVTRGIFFSAQAWKDAAEACHAWIVARPELDDSRLAVRGVSFGTYFGTVVAAQLGDRIKGFAASGVCQEPGCDTIFNKASPTFKIRFMFMSGYQDEAAFDAFCKSIDLRPLAPRIKAPYMIVAGENDQLSPVEHTENLFRLIEAPKRLVIYEGANHGVGDAASVTFGEDKVVMMLDWLLDRVNGKPAVSERIFVDSSGRARTENFS